MPRPPNEARVAPRGVCPVCRRRYRLRRDGTVPRHGDLAGPPVAPYDDNTCAGSEAFAVVVGEPINPKLVRAGGRIHLLGAIQGGEFTLCGIAFDAHQSENEPDLKFLPTTDRPVNCNMCVAEILNCRGVRVSNTPRTISTRNA